MTAAHCSGLYPGIQPPRGTCTATLRYCDGPNDRVAPRDQTSIFPARDSQRLLQRHAPSASRENSRRMPSLFAISSGKNTSARCHQFWEMWWRWRDLPRPADTSSRRDHQLHLRGRLASGPSFNDRRLVPTRSFVDRPHVPSLAPPAARRGGLCLPCLTKSKIGGTGFGRPAAAHHCDATLSVTLSVTWSRCQSANNV